MLEPEDMLILDRLPNKKYIDFTPLLVTEVHSPSTRERDRGYKFQRYQKHGIPYYLMVDVDAETVEVYELHNGKFALAIEDHAFIHPFVFADDCTASIDFANIW